MATQKQIAANRKNAKHSTGPRTPEGKNKVRLNSTRDGITGQVITLSEGDRPAFEKFSHELMLSLSPEDPMELTLANAVAWDSWRLNRLRAIEMNLLSLPYEHPDIVIESASPEVHIAVAQAVNFASDSARLALMSLYEQRLTRNLHKNLAALRDLQAERRHNYQRDLDDEITVARANDIDGLKYRAPREPSPNGFVFSNDEVVAAANRRTLLNLSRFSVSGHDHKVRFAAASSETDRDSENPATWRRPNAA